MEELRLLPICMGMFARTGYYLHERILSRDVAGKFLKARLNLSLSAKRDATFACRAGRVYERWQNIRHCEVSSHLYLSETNVDMQPRSLIIRINRDLAVMQGQVRLCVCTLAVACDLGGVAHLGDVLQCL